MAFKVLAHLTLAFGSVLAQGCRSDKGGAVPDVEKLVAPHQDQALASVVTKADRAEVTDLFVFGDSLSDTGRLHDKTFGFYLPSNVYWRGRATNGPVWVDYVCGALSCRAHNYAMAGAATGSTGFPTSLVLTSLSDQVDRYVADDSSASLNTSLMVIWIGPNNYLGASSPDIKAAGADIKAAAKRLLDHGVQHLAVGSMPDLSGSLKAPGSGRKSDAVLRQITDDHNQMIAQLLTELRAAYPRRQIALFDAHATNQASVEDQAAYGFTHLKKACYQGSYSGHFDGDEAFCTDFLGVKLWDYLHPNTRMHCHYAAGFLADAKTAGWLSDFHREDAAKLCQHLVGGQPR